MPTSTKRLQIGFTQFDIAGLSAADPYFASLHDNFEPEFERVGAEYVREGYVCADIGANLGIKSLLLSQYAKDGRVIAIEPSPQVSALLEQNVARSSCRNIQILKTAVGENEGTAHFSDNSAYGHMLLAGGVEVPVTRLSSIIEKLNLNRLDFVKIDCEGFEFGILRDSLDLLNRYGSLVFLEFNSWCQLIHADANPRVFAEWIFQHFDHILMVRPGQSANYLERLPSKTGAIDFLHTNLVHDHALTDLLITNAEGRISIRPDQLRFDLQRAASERDAALEQLRGVRQSTSWKLTAPLRTIARLAWRKS